jgi:hypothetical protein
MEHYGHGKSTGFDQSALGKIQTGFTPEFLTMSDRDWDILRRLTERVARIAATPKMAEMRLLWKRHNKLEKVRPLVFCDPENGWNEVITEAQMECTGALARHWEMDLRKEMFWGEEMGDDRPVEPFFDVPYTSAPDDWGLAVFVQARAATGSRYGNSVRIESPPGMRLCLWRHRKPGASGITHAAPLEEINW